MAQKKTIFDQMTDNDLQVKFKSVGKVLFIAFT